MVAKRSKSIVVLTTHTSRRFSFVLALARCAFLVDEKIRLFRPPIPTFSCDSLWIWVILIPSHGKSLSIQLLDDNFYLGESCLETVQPPNSCFPPDSKSNANPKFFRQNPTERLALEMGNIGQCASNDERWQTDRKWETSAAAPPKVRLTHVEVTKCRVAISLQQQQTYLL